MDLAPVFKSSLSFHRWSTTGVSSDTVFQGGEHSWRSKGLGHNQVDYKLSLLWLDNVYSSSVLRGCVNPRAEHVFADRSAHGMRADDGKPLLSGDIYPP
jgi:hypothetical protein